MNALEECGMDATECETYCENVVEYPDIQDGDVCKKE